MSQKKSSSLFRLIPSFKYSLSGFKFALQEGAFRLEIYIFLLIMLAAFIFNLIWWKKLIIFSAWFVLLIIEVINSAIEACIDRISYEKHELSKLAKDLASFAVLLGCILSIVITSIMFYI